MLFLSSRIVTISQRIKMQNYAGLLYGFVVLHLCDYGMASSSTLESPTAGPGLNISTSNITVTTAESTSVTFASNGSESTTHDNTTTVIFTTISTTPDHTLTSEEDKSVMRTTASKASNASIFSIPANKDNSGQYAGGVVILIFIIILIIILLGILYFLRKKGRSYSFDLTQTSCSPNDYEEPLQNLEQQVISYEQTDKDLPVCLDYAKEDDQWSNGPKTSPTAYGCAEETTDPTADGDNVFQHAEEQNFPEDISSTSSISLTPPVRKVEFSLDLDLISGDSGPNSPTTVDTCDAAQNENNNNMTQAGCGAAEEIFTEVSLDEPEDHP